HSARGIPGPSGPPGQRPLRFRPSAGHARGRGVLQPLRPAPLPSPAGPRRPPVSRDDVPAAAFVTVFGCTALFVLGAILALDAAVLWLVYHALLRFAGTSYYPERASAYEALQYAFYGCLAAPCCYAGLRRSQALDPDRSVLWACLAFSVGATFLLGLGLGSAH